MATWYKKVHEDRRFLLKMDYNFLKTVARYYNKNASGSKQTMIMALNLVDLSSLIEVCKEIEPTFEALLLEEDKLLANENDRITDNEFSLGELLGILGIVVAVIAWLIPNPLLAVEVNIYENPLSRFHSFISSKNTEDSASLKLLVLDFDKLRYCSKGIKCEEALASRAKSVLDQAIGDSLYSVHLYTDSTYQFMDRSLASELIEKYGYNIIVWGEFEEICSDYSFVVNLKMAIKVEKNQNVFTNQLKESSFHKSESRHSEISSFALNTDSVNTDFDALLILWTSVLLTEKDMPLDAFDLLQSFPKWDRKFAVPLMHSYVSIGKKARRPGIVINAFAALTDYSPKSAITALGYLDDMNFKLQSIYNSTYALGDRRFIGATIRSFMDAPDSDKEKFYLIPYYLARAGLTNVSDSLFNAIPECNIFVVNLYKAHSAANMGEFNKFMDYYQQVAGELLGGRFSTGNIIVMMVESLLQYGCYEEVESLIMSLDHRNENNYLSINYMELMNWTKKYNSDYKSLSTMIESLELNSKKFNKVLVAHNELAVYMFDVAIYNILQCRNCTAFESICLVEDLADIIKFSYENDLPEKLVTSINVASAYGGTGRKILNASPRGFQRNRFDIDSIAPGVYRQKNYSHDWELYFASKDGGAVLFK